MVDREKEEYDVLYESKSVDITELNKENAKSYTFGSVKVNLENMRRWAESEFNDAKIPIPTISQPSEAQYVRDKSGKWLREITGEEYSLCLQNSEIPESLAKEFGNNIDVVNIYHTLIQNESAPIFWALQMLEDLYHLDLDTKDVLNGEHTKVSGVIHHTMNAQRTFSKARYHYKWGEAALRMFKWKKSREDSKIKHQDSLDFVHYDAKQYHEKIRQYARDIKQRNPSSKKRGMARIITNNKVFWAELGIVPLSETYIRKDVLKGL